MAETTAPTPAYCIGIDLGTSNSALAVSTSPDLEPEILPIPQVTAPGALGEGKTLPSALYIPHEGEIPKGAARLPWTEETSVETVVGLWARERGAQAPERLVASAKSWLCNPLTDRREPILPWKSDIPEGKVSPVEASRRILDHLRNAFDEARKAHKDKVRLKDCKVVLTVPASFDEVARALTVEAAEAAGLGRVTLLEEPQAAFYAWIATNAAEWRKLVSPGDVVLVVDVGGGTTDFSLISVSQQDGNLRLERISVGEHLLLGGDNMDLALAYTLKAQMEKDGGKVDHWTLLTLVHQARLAKEKLLSEDVLKEVPISVAGRGSSLFAKTMTTKLTRKTVLDVVNAFFPLTDVTELPEGRRSVGFQEYGLPFVSDPAISKHLARFLTRSLDNIKSDKSLAALVGQTIDLKKAELVKPTAVLFNGGVFNAAPLRARVMDVLQKWAGKDKVRELPGGQYDLAVAKGAAAYARTIAESKGIRIKAGTARSYYVGVEPSMPAIPGYRPPIKGLCIVPQGIEEGSELVLENEEFGLVTGEPVEFRFFSSAVRAGDGVGAVVADAEHDLEETSRLKITLPPVHGRTGEIVPVNLDALVTEVGTLELSMRHKDSGKKWNLEFNVRPNG